MAERNCGIGLTDAEISRCFSDPKWADRFPPVLSVKLAAELADVPIATIYNWSSRKLLANCAKKVGRYVRIFRDRFVKQLFNEGIHGQE